MPVITEQTLTIANKMARSRVLEHTRLGSIKEECRARRISVLQGEMKMQHSLTEAIAQEYIQAGSADMEMLERVYARQKGAAA